MKAMYEIERDRDNKIRISESEINNCYPHFHQQIELLYILKGAKKIAINNNSDYLTEKQFAICDSFDIHSYYNDPTSNSLVVIIPYTYFDNYYLFKKNRTLESNFIKDEKITKKIFLAMNELSNYNNGNDVLVRGLINTILGIVLEEIPLITKSKQDDLEFIKNLLIYIDENFTEEISLCSLCEHFNYSRSYLSRTFNKYVKCNLTEYLNRLRSRYVINILKENPANKLSDTVFNAGFSSMQTFFRTFKKEYDQTLTEYLEKNK
jgi:AraC-like DNA-binding protein